MSKEGSFKVIKVTDIDDLEEGKEIPESDVTFQTEKQIIQLEHQEREADGKKYIIKPGCWTIEDGAFGTTLKKFDLKNYHLLESIDNTSTILSEKDKFFSKLDIYKSLKRDPKRAILLCSPPGVGKTAAINKACKIALEQEGTAAIFWDTSDIRSSVVNRFFLHKSKFSKKVKRLIFVIEDIGGGTVEEYGGSRGADSSLLNLLDGVGQPFGDVPTFIISTTNNPEQSVGALIDRPGRFDKVIELKTPGVKETKELLQFIADRELNEEDVKAAEIAAHNKFSIAHIQEIVVRSLLDDVTTEQAAHQLKDHKDRCKEEFTDNTRKMGLGI